MANDADPRTLLLKIVSVLGVASLGGASAGCAERVGGDDTSTDGADDVDTQDESSESGESGESDSESGESDSDEEDTDVPFPDMGADSSTDTEQTFECSELEPVWGEFTPPRDCNPETTWGLAPVCFMPPAGTTCEQEPFDVPCLLGAYSCGLSTVGNVVECGPYTTAEGACCYIVSGDCVVGRPFFVDDVARVAEQACDPGWVESQAPDLRGLDDASKAALADAWARDGLTEHASVASFARFTLQLLSLGAPASLVEASVRAGMDEVRHATRCFGLASAYAGSPIGPTALDVNGCLAGDQSDPIAIATRLAAEGCIAETVSTLLLAAARDRARDPAVRAVLTETVSDEVEHVLLAWEALAWMCREGSAELRSAVARVFSEAASHVGFGATTTLPGDPKHMRAHGYLAVAQRRELAIEALERVVGPAAQALLEGSGAPLEQLDQRVAG